jgi:hypothetical protein
MATSPLFLISGDARRSRLPYCPDMRFPDSTFAALAINGESDEPFRWGRLMLLAIALTIAAASAGLVAGG